MKTPHTPGPWTTQELEHAYHGYENWNTYCIRSPQNVHIATIGHVDRYHEQDHEANARLIAAAPELLEALEFISKWENMKPENALPKQLHNAIASAIAKAKEQP
jgi:hypothetical protein